MRAIRVSLWAVAIHLLVGLLAMACGTSSPPPSTSLSPSPLSPTLSGPTLSPPPTPAPSPQATLQPVLWVGPLLYPTWHLRFERTGVPIYDLGAGEVRWLQTSEPVSKILDWAPEGCQVAYLAQDEARSEDCLRVVHLGTLEDNVLFCGPHSPWDWIELDWSPTGEWIAYRPVGRVADLENQLHLIRPDGSERKRLTADPYFSHMAGWIAGGQEILYWSFFPSRRAQAEPWEGVWQLNMLDIRSMEGRAVARYSQPLESWEDLVITDVRTLQPLWPAGIPEPEGVRFVDLYWTPDLNDFLIITAKDTDELLFGANMYLLDTVERQTRKMNSREFNLVGFGSQSLDGLLFAFVGQHFEAKGLRTYGLHLATGEIQSLGPEGVVLGAPNWSPDNRMLSVIQRYGGQGLDWGSYVYVLDTGQVIRLPDVLFDPGAGVVVGWSPRIRYGPDACRSAK